MKLTDRTAVCLMGPTAVGKTDIAVSLCKRFPFEVVSVDSALVYRGMDVGTAKPDAATLARVPHRLVDIRDPEDTYSAGEFVRDAANAQDEIFAAGRIPLLVGGTMMYFHALTAGIALLPSANPEIRAVIDRQAADAGWPAMHATLAEDDPDTASRISPNDSQRIQRALEVFRISGRPLSDWQAQGRRQSVDKRTCYIKVSLQPDSRAVLHQRIADRLNLMINNGFLHEVNVLRKRPGLASDAPSMRAVGYRQFWSHAAGDCSLEEARYRALVATRQLAKRQMTWLRSESASRTIDPLAAGPVDTISTFLAGKLR